MKYIQNNGRYAYSFEVIVKDRAKKIVLDRRRIYLDTGNVATTGITEIEEEVLEALKGNAKFNAFMQSGELELTEPSELETTEKKAEALEAENKELRKKLEEAEKGNKDKDIESALEEKDKQITSLKAKLEALSKNNKKEKSTKDETEGF